MDEIRSHCRGIVPMPGRLVPWQRALLHGGDLLRDLVEKHGSPCNFIDPDLLPEHADELVRAGKDRAVGVDVFFARKANKALTLVDAALAAGHGVDVASEAELRQVLDQGAEPHRVIVTAAVKPRALIRLALEAQVVISVDNLDELELITTMATSMSTTARLALRLRARSAAPSRFGLSAEQWQALSGDSLRDSLRVEGIHFHLHGYDASTRVAALHEAIGLAEAIRSHGHPVSWIDIGGGIPMNYLEDPTDWVKFWAAHRHGLLTDEPLTWSARGLGLQRVGDELVGTPAVYPMAQTPVRGAWLASVLDAPFDGSTIAAGLTRRGLRLHVEPGRALLDGGGLTVARVEARKIMPNGTCLVALAMSRTQCRSAADDFLLDPILVPLEEARSPTGPIEGYLVGAYCIEAELLTWRRLAFPHGVAVGDLVAFVNTAGYQMHILESASHQIPLAANLVPDGLGGWTPDLIDGV